MDQTHACGRTSGGKHRPSLAGCSVDGAPVDGDDDDGATPREAEADAGANGEADADEDGDADGEDALARENDCASDSCL